MWGSAAYSVSEFTAAPVSISSLANGAFGEHRGHESDGISPEIAPPG
jgi:hypothetical protein